MTKQLWVGFTFPTRLLTVEEIETLSPNCERCSLPAVVVELQEPLTKAVEKSALISIPNGVLKFYCGHHTSLDISDEVMAQTDWAFYERIRVPVLCPKYDNRRYASNCLSYQPNCLKRCQPIQRMIVGMPSKVALDLANRGKALYTERKEAAAVAAAAAAAEGENHGSSDERKTD